MNRSIRPTLLAILFSFVIIGCSSNEPRNITSDASQEEIDNYNELIEQAEKEMQGDGEVEDLED
jgi:hypothetical protein